MDDASIMVQTEGTQPCAGIGVISVQNALNPKTFRDFNEQRGVFDIDYLLGRRLGDV